MKNDGDIADNLGLPAKGLPNPKTLRWAHSTRSKDDLEKALQDRYGKKKKRDKNQVRK